MLCILSAELTGEIFYGSVLKRRLISKLHKLWSVGSESRPIFFRLTPVPNRDYSVRMAFLSRISAARLLILHDSKSAEASDLIATERDFSVVTVQENTMTDVMKATQDRDVESIYSLSDRTIASLPFFLAPVLQHIIS
jgi:hypothetical protein